jgi:pimeloyl-ACP methyl ester carboxylesterase
MKKILAKLVGLYLNLLAIIAPRAAGRKGFNFFCTPFTTPLKDHQRQFLDTAEKSSFLCDGVKIQVYRWGHGDKKILFLHGWQSHSFRWKNYIEALPKDRYTLYALDAPGHGLSGGKYLNLPAYSQVIESFLYMVQPVDTVVSHSLGSFAALFTLYRVQGFDLKKLVITGTPGDANDFIKFYSEVLGLSKRTTRVILKAFEEMIHHPPGYFLAAKFASAIKIPTLIVHDQHDDEAPYRYAVDIRNSMENSRLITTSGLGHNLRSHEVIKHLVDFIDDGAKENSVQVVRLHLN